MNEFELLQQSIGSVNLILICLALLSVLLLYIFRKKIIWRLFAFDERGEKILAQKKSSEVKVGQIVETLSPVLKGFPVDVRKEGTSIAFIGRPVDFVYFDPDKGITFIEVKSGSAKLSPVQQKLKKLVEKGKISWAEYRIDGSKK